ncbi:hypothetical protein CTEN210_09111 [Chaetoceros tenuissimus]|uniref:Uncharacterized protein n=1 Tax=Chaetoceros tenuissimus TaxID=426638 RepID=A0AAD3CX71_9STRA|nr:hypothetical protein CTEN210_09111 [Chaetoceros tenuissimus]
MVLRIRVRTRTYVFSFTHIVIVIIASVAIRSTTHAFTTPITPIRKVTASFRRSSELTTCNLSTSLASTISAPVANNAKLAVQLNQPLLSPMSLDVTTNYFVTAIYHFISNHLRKFGVLVLILGILFYNLQFFQRILQNSLSRQRVSKKKDENEGMPSISQAYINDSDESAVEPTEETIEEPQAFVQPQESIKKPRLFKRAYQKMKQKVSSLDTTIPIDFESTPKSDWKAWLVNKSPIGNFRSSTSHMQQYTFSLPKKENVIQLNVGQMLTLKYRDKKQRTVQKDYYIHEPQRQLGTRRRGKFSIVTSGASKESSNTEGEVYNEFGRTTFEKVLQNGLEIGDEVEFQPGPNTLDYRGEHFPVREMVYFAEGIGIIPVLEQMKVLLKKGKSSVESMALIWAAAKEEDFDIALQTLESLYYKNSNSLSVSCVLHKDNLYALDFSKNDVECPMHNPGSMAVISGEREFALKGIELLIAHGYPENCICILPTT